VSERAASPLDVESSHPTAAPALDIRRLEARDRPRVDDFVADRWGSRVIAVHDELIQPSQLEGYVAESDGRWSGLVTYRIADGDCEIVTLDSTSEGSGLGTALVEAVAGVARTAGCGRIWLVTTNDNLRALRFYQRRGFELVAVHRGAAARSRCLKPELPCFGDDGIPIRDEIELERGLATS